MRVMSSIRVPVVVQVLITHHRHHNIDTASRHQEVHEGQLTIRTQISSDGGDQGSGTGPHTAGESRGYHHQHVSRP